MLLRGSFRYKFIKATAAIEHALGVVLRKERGVDKLATNEGFDLAIKKFKEAYEAKLTSTMFIAGQAMAPALNRAALTDKDAVEMLIIRLLPRSAVRNIMVGDVIAFHSPLTPPSSEDISHVMVRRVAALEGEELVASGSDSSSSSRGTPPGDDDGVEEGDTIEVPKDHCWVLADNEDLKPPEVIDSRVFGHIPLNNVVGRVIYAVESKTQHGPVTNHPNSMLEDSAIIEAEVNVEELLRDQES